MNKTYYILRHALSTYSLNGYGDQILTANILPEAIPPIKKMAKYLKNVETDFNACSEIKRCQQTAAIVTEIAGKKFVFDQRLNEYYQETFEQLRDRIKQFLADLEKKPYQNILICTHGAVIAGLKNLLLNDNFEETEINDYPSCGTLLIIKEEKTEEIDFNK